jgi:hypothetical protein
MVKDVIYNFENDVTTIRASTPMWLMASYQINGYQNGIVG